MFEDDPLLMLRTAEMLGTTPDTAGAWPPVDRSVYTPPARWGVWGG
jgi:hypothetical protein